MITKDMKLFDLIQQYPQVRQVFKKYNMHCVDCMGAQAETLEAGARMHDIDVEQLLADIKAVTETTNE